jgi:hypothetical protein
MSDIIDTSAIQQTVRMHRKMVQDQFHRDNPVVLACEAMRSYITEFESGLDPDQEVGVRLVSFGNAVFFHAEEIGFYKPSVICFKGVTPEGDRVQLVQHVSQLSFLLKAVPKLAEQPRRIGFVWQE